MLLSTSSLVRAAESPPESSLSVDTPLSSEGYFVLSWDTGSAGETYILQRALSPDFRDTLDRPIAGTGTLTITGQGDDRYYYRVGSPEAGWSNTVEVVVEHHSLGRAFGFFSLGLVLFAVLIFVILSGHRTSRRTADGS